jgi:hypothetical protein
MDINGRPDTLEDFLVQHRTGQWFGFDNLNGDEANKTYENFIVHDGGSKPTEQECIDGLAQLQTEYDALDYARKRKAEYPTIEELVVALYDTDDKSAIEAKRAEVKAKYPK